MLKSFSALTYLWAYCAQAIYFRLKILLNCFRSATFNKQRLNANYTFLSFYWFIYLYYFQIQNLIYVIWFCHFDFECKILLENDNYRVVTKNVGSVYQTIWIVPTLLIPVTYPSPSCSHPSDSWPHPFDSWFNPSDSWPYPFDPSSPPLWFLIPPMWFLTIGHTSKVERPPWY